jgi:cytochrome c oxidase assembly protein subunit 15
MKPGPIRSLVLTALLLVLVITTTSAYIRLSQAGLGCADWPACYGRAASLPEAGQLLPGDSSLFWARALHRLAASTVGLLLLLIAFLGRDAFGGTAGRLGAWVAVALAGLLAGLGMITPSELPAVTLGNLLGGMALAVLLWGLHQRGRGNPVRAGRVLLWLAVAALALQIALGGMIGARRAALACISLPACGGTWWPDPVDWRLFNPFFVAPAPDQAAAALAALALAHRYGALLAAAKFTCRTLTAWARRPSRRTAPSWPSPRGCRGGWRFITRATRAAIRTFFITACRAGSGASSRAIRA